jgi:hypothetical protein
MSKKLLLYSSPLIQVKKESSIVKASPDIFRRPVKIIKSNCSSLLSRQVKKNLFSSKGQPLYSPEPGKNKTVQLFFPPVTPGKKNSLVKDSPYILRRPVKIIKSNCSSLLSRQVKKAL